MKAFVFTQHHHIEPIVHDVPALPEEHALIKLSHCGISQMDVDTYLGREQKVAPPKVLGSEICGTVIKINSPGTPSELEGVRVAVDPIISCGQCDECRKGKSNHCENIDILGCTYDGGFADYVIVPVKNVYPLPVTGDIECFTLASPLASALHLDSIVHTEKEGRCVILGSRPVDILYGLVLRRRSGIDVIIIDDNPFRLNIAQSLGLSCIDLSSAGNNTIMDELFFENDTSIDIVVIGSSKIKNSLTLGINLVAPRGQIYVTRNLHNNEQIEPGDIIEKELIFRGVNLYDKENFTKSVDDIASYSENFSSLITHRLPFAGIENGLQIVETVPECMKVILIK